VRLAVDLRGEIGGQSMFVFEHQVNNFDAMWYAYTPRYVPGQDGDHGWCARSHINCRGVRGAGM
jgi:hypothetical protein